jgi:hypothetical protein
MGNARSRMIWNPLREHEIRHRRRKSGRDKPIVGETIAKANTARLTSSVKAQVQENEKAGF